MVITSVLWANNIINDENDVILWSDGNINDGIADNSELSVNSHE